MKTFVITSNIKVEIEAEDKAEAIEKFLNEGAFYGCNQDLYGFLVEHLKVVPKKNKKVETIKFAKRKTGEHEFADCGGCPRCVTCGADEDDAFTAGEKCTYVKGK